jgi:hypothetical protein
VPRNPVLPRHGLGALVLPSTVATRTRVSPRGNLSSLYHVQHRPCCSMTPWEARICFCNRCAGRRFPHAMCALLSPAVLRCRVSTTLSEPISLVSLLAIAVGCSHIYLSCPSKSTHPTPVPEAPPDQHGPRVVPPVPQSAQAIV